VFHPTNSIIGLCLEFEKEKKEDRKWDILAIAAGGLDDAFSIALSGGVFGFEWLWPLATSQSS
jgi:hypothetical protein